MAVTTIPQTTPRRPLLKVLSLLVGLGAVLWFLGSWLNTAAPMVRESVDQPLGAATRADVEIAMGMGYLRISALDEPSTLVAGEIFYPQGNSVTQTFATNGDTASFTLREHDKQANSLIKYKNETTGWTLGLNPTTPLNLTLQAGIGENTIDLSQLHVTDLSLETGIGMTVLTLPRQGHVQAQITSGIGNTTIKIPAGVAVRVTIDRNVGSVEFPDRYWKQGDVYVSPDFDPATDHIELAVNSGIGNVTIQSVSE